MADILDIEEGVLNRCTDKCARSVTIPDGVTEIGEKVFLRDWKLTSVQISASVTKIGGSAFYGCEALESVKFGGTVAQWEAVKGKAELLKNIPATIVKCADGEWQTPVLLVEYGVLVKCFDKSMTSVTIPDGVTEIGEHAFHGCESLKSVVIGDGVTKISENAFSYCESLSSVVISNSVTEIGEYAFYDCDALSSVEFGGTVAQWEAVKGKVELLRYIPATVVKCEDGEWQTPSVLVEYGVFAKCFDKSVTSMVIGEDITEIGNYAFGGCTSLTSVVIPNSVKKIDYNAFEHCTSLSSLEIPYGVTEIGEYAFAVCSSLESVKIPSSVKRIEREAFFDCKRLSKVVLGDDFDNVTAEWFDSLEKANPNYEIVCTKDSSTYKAIELSQKLKMHNKEIALRIAKDQKMAEVQKTGAEALIKSLLESIEESSFEIISNTKSETIVLVKIAKNAGVFKLDTDSSTWLPKIQKAIEIFSDSSKSGAEIFEVIEKQKIPLTEIPDEAKITLKAGSDGFLKIFASGELKRVYYDNSLKNLELFGVTKIGEDAFFNDCVSLESVKIPDSVTEIGKNAFGYCIALPSVIIPNSVTKIGEYAFSKCKSLSSIKIPDSVTEIGRNAFAECKSLSSVESPNSVTKIDYDVFAECKSLSSVIIPNSVTKIEGWAFYKCKSLSSVVIPDSVTEIDKFALQNCNITELSHPCLTIKNGLAIQDNTVLYFASQSRSFTIPDGITKIGVWAFYDCKSIKSVKIPSSVTEIVKQSFVGCTSLASVEFNGTVAQWKAVKKGEDWHDHVPAKFVKCTDGEAKL